MAKKGQKFKIRDEQLIMKIVKEKIFAIEEKNNIVNFYLVWF